ncbi:DNA primase [Salmonella enterica]|nr:DNA primase [Salmonella enterica]
MKNAPNYNQLPYCKATEAIIFVGADAYAHAKHWTESEGKRHGDNVPPVYLGKKQLAELANTRIVDKGRERARIYIAANQKTINKVSESTITAIVEKLAEAGVQEVKIFKGIPDTQPETLNRERMEAIRERVKRGEGIVVNFPGLINGNARNNDDTQPGDDLKPRVISRADGVYWIAPKMDTETREIIYAETWLCSPLEVIGTGTDDAKQYYFVLRWKAPNRNTEITRAFLAGDIGERDGWRALKSGGVKVVANPRHRGLLSDWIQQSAPAQEWGISHRAGWFRGAYIMPDGEVIGEPEKPVIFSGGSAAASGYTVSGTPESWRDSVARLAGGNPMMMLGIAVSLAAPLISLVNADGFGVHLFDNSTAGKTTTADTASSVWGNPDLLRLTWYGTALGIANEAEAHNDSLLPMDEIGQGTSAKDVATSAYTLFNGAGKLQGAKDGGNRELRRWRTVAISTGEKDVETFLAGEGIRVKAGQLVRLLNIPMEKSTVHHEHGNGERHAKALKAAYSENHGATGREWVKWLAGHQQEAKDAVKAARERWCSLVPDSYGEQARRVADRFAILEAALIAGQHLTGWSEQESRDAMQHCFNAWVGEFGTGNKEHQQIIRQCEAFLNAYGFSRYLPYPNTDPRDLPIRDLAGYRVESVLDDEMTKFYTYPATFEDEIAAGFNPVAFGKTLSAVGMLERSNDRLKRKALGRIGGKQHTFYVLRHRPDSEEEDAEE